MEDYIRPFLKCGAMVRTTPGHLIIGWGKRTWLKEPSANHLASFYFPQFFLTDAQPWLVYEHTLEVSILDLISLIEREIHATNDFTDLHWHIKGKEVFVEAFEELQNLFKAGTLQKAVPYIFEITHAKMQQNLLNQMIHSVLHKATLQAIFPYGFWDEHLGIIGATPEILFNFDQKKLSTIACAGTYPKGQESLLLQDQKELHEHELVVKGISESLNNLGQIKQGGTQAVSFPSLCHLMTPIELEAKKPISFTEAVEALHPTPALGALPQAEGRVWLNSYQTKLNRGRYGAPAGYFMPSKGIGGCYVAIRNVQWCGSEMKIGAGCGVVPQSQLDKEWQEIQLKLQSIKNLFTYEQKTSPAYS